MEMYGFPKMQQNQLPLQYYSLQKLAVKLDWSNTLYALEVMLSNFKILNTTRFLSAGLTVLWLYVDPLAISVGTQFFHNAGDCCLITTMFFWQTFVLSAIACPLIVHYRDCAIKLVATTCDQIPPVINRVHYFTEWNRPDQTGPIANSHTILCNRPDKLDVT